MIDCDFCEAPFEPVASRWLCPHCHSKLSCCEGAPLPETEVDVRRVFRKLVDG